MKAFQLVLLLAGCTFCSKRLPDAGNEPRAAADRVEPARSSAERPATPARTSDSCQIPISGSLLFSDCANEAGQVAGNDCYTYRLRDADGRDGKPPCLTELLALDIDGPGGHARGALVRGEIAGNGPDARVSLRVERITLWSDAGVKAGDTIGHVVVVNGRIVALELSEALRAESKKKTVALVRESQVAPRNGECVFTYESTASFTECVSPPRTHPSVPDCYEYSLVPIGQDTGSGICVPGAARFRIVGAIGYFREAIVDTEVVSDDDGTADGALLRVRKIEAWPDHEFQVGDVVGTLRSPKGKPVALELGQRLRSKTGTKVLKASE